MATTLYLVNGSEEGHCETDHLALKRIFTTREAVDAFMLSLPWHTDFGHGTPSVMLPFTAYKVEYDESGKILTMEELEYWQHAPPIPANAAHVAPCNERLKTKMLSAIAEEDEGRR